MQPHDMAEQGLLGMPISSLITRVSGRCSSAVVPCDTYHLYSVSLGYLLLTVAVCCAVSAREVYIANTGSLGRRNEIIMRLATELSSCFVILSFYCIPPSLHFLISSFPLGI